MQPEPGLSLGLALALHTSVTNRGLPFLALFVDLKFALGLWRLVDGGKGDLSARS
jgi:hypothetical protein